MRRDGTYRGAAAATGRRVTNAPTRREWLVAWLDGLERSCFTGTVSLTLNLAHGGITRLVVQEERKPIT